jgi:hypothetical protein
MSDPNGWVTQPPSTLVKVVNTSRDSINDKLGVVLAYQTDRSRYVVHLSTSQERVSLTADKLVKASYMEQMRAQYELLQNNPQIQQQIQRVYTQVHQAAGVKPEYLAGAALVAILVAIYVFGFSKVLMTISFFMMIGLVVLPDLQAGASAMQVTKNAPMRVKAIIRQNVPMVGGRIADSNILTGLIVAMTLFFFVNALAAGGNRTASVVPVPPPSSVTYTPKVVADRSLLEDYYKRGFEDAQAGNDFGVSLPVPEVTTPAGVDDTSEFSWPGSDYAAPPAAKPSPLGQLTSWSSLISLFLIGNTLYGAGKTGEGGFDVHLMLANLRHLDVMKQGMLAFSLYRLISPFFK